MSIEDLRLKSIDWWQSLTEKECIKILKENNIYGHDLGVNESEILKFYLQSLND